MAEKCECASPWVSGNRCDKCNKEIAPERLTLLPKEAPKKASIGISPTRNETRVALDDGIEAALRVKKYGTLWDQVGSIINILNSVGAGALIIFLFISGLGGKLILLGIVFIAVLWGISYLQISIIKGLASYFQMRSADYLERKNNK